MLQDSDRLELRARTVSPEDAAEGEEEAASHGPPFFIGTEGRIENCGDDPNNGGAVIRLWNKHVR